MQTTTLTLSRLALRLAAPSTPLAPASTSSPPSSWHSNPQHHVVHSNSFHDERMSGACAATPALASKRPCGQHQASKASPQRHSMHYNSFHDESMSGACAAALVAQGHQKALHSGLLHERSPSKMPQHDSNHQEAAVGAGAEHAHTTSCLSDHSSWQFFMHAQGCSLMRAQSAPCEDLWEGRLTNPDHLGPPLPPTRAMKARPKPAMAKITLTVLLAFCHLRDPARCELSCILRSHPHNHSD